MITATSQMYYLYKDHLGSITAIANQSGIVIEHRSFDAKRLLYTMGHEFVHVSQFAALSGQSSFIITEHFINMLEFHAYNYSSQLGQEFMTPMFPNGEIQGFMNSFPDYFYKLGWNNFRWTYNYRFIDPF